MRPEEWVDEVWEGLAGTDGNVTLELDILAYNCFGMDCKFVSTGDKTMSYRAGEAQRRGEITLEA